MSKFILSYILISIFSIQNIQSQTFLLHSFYPKTYVYMDFILEEDIGLDNIKCKNFIAKVESLVNSQKQKIWTAQKLRVLFHKTHRKFLKTYDFNADFADLVDGKKYNCVTASILFVLIFDRLNIQYEIHETPFHVYLKVWTDKGKCILLETTNKFDGFVNNTRTIEEMEAQFKNPYTEQDIYLNQDIFNHIVSLEQLIALYFYNLGIEAFNEKSHLKAQNWLLVAKQMYPEKRIVALYDLNEGFISSK